VGGWHVAEGAGSVSVIELTVPEAARIMREAVKDKSYQLLPLGEEAARYLAAKRKRLSENSALAYEATLDKFCRHFADLRIEDFEPPVGTERVEEFLDAEWGGCKATTYNRHLAVMREFFKFVVMRGRLQANPMLTIEPAKARQAIKETFSDDQCRLIIASQDSLRDRLALRLLLQGALRRGSLQRIQFKHFDHSRKVLTVTIKGGKVRELPITDDGFWNDLARHVIESGAEPHHYLLASRWANRFKADKEFPGRPMSAKGLHKWWYRCLANAGIVPVGTTAGERMHKARHTAGQRLLDRTKGNLKAVQALQMHESIQTTADLYTDWDLPRLAATLAEVEMWGEGD
jgi:integrase/recombinase XerC